MRSGVAPGGVPRWRGIFCNRTLNMRSIRAVGYDMDYTLIHYKVEDWERLAFQYAQGKLLAAGLPVEGTTFDPSAVIRGLIIDRELGNIVKANRFGYIKAASHGTRQMDFEEQRKIYARTVVDLGEQRFVFLNTLFGLSEAWLYAHLVDRLDAGRMSERPTSYSDLYAIVRRTIDETHMEGALKAEIVADPERYIELDPETPLALLDQRQAGKKLLLVTNSGWPYTCSIMSYAFDRYLPKGMAWRDLFDIIICSSRKPAFFIRPQPVFRVVDEAGHLSPHLGPLQDGGVYVGAHAGLVEESLGLEGEQILYVGDHVYGDVHVSKSVRRWRTALILHELEAELMALDSFEETQAQLTQLMAHKSQLESAEAALRVTLVRRRRGYGPTDERSVRALDTELSDLRAQVQALDARIGPLARASAELSNPRWGLLMRTGHDKSNMARQVERHADIYTSRVSNFAYLTPYRYLRSSRGSLPHDD